MRWKVVPTVGLAVILLTALIAPSVSSSESPEGWSEDVRLTEHEEGWDDRVRMDSEGDNIHLVWRRRTPTDDDQYKRILSYMKSEDNGWTWSDNRSIKETESAIVGHDIAVYGENVYIVWSVWVDSAREIFFRRSLDGGDTWEEEQQITSPTSEHKYRPRVTVSDGGETVHVVWMDERFRDETTPPTIELYYKRSTDGGEAWGSEKRLTEAPYGSGGHSLVLEDSTVHLVWMDERKGIELFDIYYRRSTDDGETWNDEIALTDDGNRNSVPDVAVWDGHVHVVWHEDYEIIFYRNSTDEGGSWNEPQVLTGPVEITLTPQVAVENEDVHVVWVDGRDGGREVYYKNSEEGGITWGEDTRLTYTDESRSYQPAITLSEDTIHVIWHDDRDSDDDYYELYYKRNPDFNDVSEFANIIIPVGTVMLTVTGAMWIRKRKKKR